MVGLSPPRTDVVDGPHGPLEILTRGSGPPGTLFVHGLGGSIASTRPYAGRVRGQRTFMHLAGHGASVSAEALTYEALSQEVWAVADHVRATAVLGISMGAGAILAGLASDPARYRAVVLVLPAALDRPRDDPALGRFARLARLVHAADVEAVARHLLSHESPDVRESRQARQWSQEQAERLVDGNPQAALTQIPQQVPLHDAGRLGEVGVPVLVLAQAEDPVHPVEVAREVARSIPGAHLEIFGPGGLVWAHRGRVRAMVGEFLDQHGS